MIIVSTTSPAEARYADRALGQGLPADVAYTVYLNGKLHSERGGRPVHPAELAEWPADPEVRDAS
jgi:hypothetical protein